MHTLNTALIKYCFDNSVFPTACSHHPLHPSHTHTHTPPPHTHIQASLMSTIVGLAQNFVGSNNVNILQPLGQFGTRLHGGKDAASPR